MTAAEARRLLLRSLLRRLGGHDPEITGDPIRHEAFTIVGGWLVETPYRCRRCPATWTEKRVEEPWSP